MMGTFDLYFVKLIKEFPNAVWVSIMLLLLLFLLVLLTNIWFTFQFVHHDVILLSSFLQMLLKALYGLFLSSLLIELICVHQGALYRLIAFLPVSARTSSGPVDSKYHRHHLVVVGVVISETCIRR